MNHAFAYLMARTMRNRVVTMARRLKQPRYAIGFLFVALYFGFIIFGGLTGATRSNPKAGFITNDTIRLLAPAVLAIVLLTSWIGDAALGTLAFTQAEVAMLFPAPVTRRALIELKIVRAQLPILFNVFIFVALWGGRNPNVSRLANAVGLYTMFTTMHLHRLGAALVQSTTVKHGRNAFKRNWASYLVPVVMIAVMALVIADMGPGGRAGATTGDILSRVNSALTNPVVSALLTPFALITAPTFARTYADWALALGGALAMAALHLVWVLRSHAAFEETAAEQSERLRQMIEQFRKRGVMQPEEKVKGQRRTIPLRPTGPPAIAIVWKNTLAFMRTFRPSQLLFVMAMPAVVGFIFAAKAGDPIAVVAGVSAMLALVLLLAGGISVRNDLRADLQNLSSIKTIPLRGSAIVLAEISSSALPLAIMQTALLWVAIGALQLSKHPMPADIAISLAVTLPVGLSGLNLLTSTIRNGVAVLFPAWVRLGSDGGSPGMEMMGQAMLSVLAMLLAFIILMIVPGLVTFITVAYIHPPVIVAVASNVILGGLAIVGESYLVMLWIGRVLERTEPSASLTAS